MVGREDGRGQCEADHNGPGLNFKEVFGHASRIPQRKCGPGVVDEVGEHPRYNAAAAVGKPSEEGAEKYAWQRLSFHDDSPTGTPQKFRHGLTVMQAPSDLGVPKYLDHWPGRGGYMST